MASSRACARCGVQFTPKSSRARYCGSTCRARAADERKLAEVVEIAPAPPTVGGLVASLTAELAKVDRLDTSVGAGVLILAGRIEAGGESGAALSALHRELRAARLEAFADVRVPDSRVDGARDELAARRNA